ncbi:MAG TPA: hypothetical protein VFF98_10965 [Novosphingobium sp.]|nr:hypothetical protein [Novosphingobium sp.]HZV11391.1 hypothetical protein [Novosphingobium sp.]
MRRITLALAALATTAAFAAPAMAHPHKQPHKAAQHGKAAHGHGQVKKGHH